MCCKPSLLSVSPVFHFSGQMSTTSPRRKLPYHHHHVLRHKAQSLPSGEPALMDQEVVDTLLMGCISTICDAEAVKQTTKSASIESVALESLTAAVEECMVSFHVFYRLSSD